MQRIHYVCACGWISLNVKLMKMQMKRKYTKITFKTNAHIVNAWRTNRRSSQNGRAENKSKGKCIRRKIDSNFANFNRRMYEPTESAETFCYNSTKKSNQYHAYGSARAFRILFSHLTCLRLERMCVPNVCRSLFFVSRFAQPAEKT